MLIFIIATGTAVLTGLAVLVGRLDGRSQRAAWRRIAEERRELAEMRHRLAEQIEALAEEGRELWEWEGQLIAAAECGSCPACELRRRRGERPAG